MNDEDVPSFDSIRPQRCYQETNDKDTRNYVKERYKTHPAHQEHRAAQETS